MSAQIWIVVEYPNGHRQVGLLYPMELTDDSARVLASQIVVEGRACGHCEAGDRVPYAAIEAIDSVAAVELVRRGQWLKTGSVEA